jgi:hypothetical protein
MRRVVRKLVAGVALLASAALAAACAPVYYPVGRLPTAETLRLQPAGRPTGTVRLWTPEFLEPIDRATRESGVFAKFAIEPREARPPSTDYTVTIEIGAGERPSAGGELAYNIFAGITLGILPLVGRVDITLTATLADRRGQVLKAYKLEDSIRAVHNVVSLVVPIGAVFDPESAAASVVENMMRHLYRQIEADHLLVPAPPPPARSSSAG